MATWEVLPLQKGIAKKLRLESMYICMDASITCQGTTSFIDSKWQPLLGLGMLWPYGVRTFSQEQKHAGPRGKTFNAPSCLRIMTGTDCRSLQKPVGRIHIILSSPQS